MSWFVSSWFVSPRTITIPPQLFVPIAFVPKKIGTNKNGTNLCQNTLCQKKLAQHKLAQHKITCRHGSRRHGSCRHGSCLHEPSQLLPFSQLSKIPASLQLLHMQFVNAYINRWKKIPAEVRSILIKGFAFLVIWKLLYAFWLAPTRLLDKPLTTLVANQSAWVMNLFSTDNPYTVGNTLRQRSNDKQTYTEYGTIFYQNKATINIADPCNGLEFLLLYAWFILVMPGTVKRRIAFLAGGLLLLHISNLFRCWGLVEIYRQYRHSFDFAHHYLFKIIIYSLSFLLWYWYLKAVKKIPEKTHAN